MAWGEGVRAKLKILASMDHYDAQHSPTANLSVDNSTSILATATNTQFTAFQTKPSRCPPTNIKTPPQKKWGKKKQKKQSHHTQK